MKRLIFTLMLACIVSVSMAQQNKKQKPVPGPVPAATSPQITQSKAKFYSLCIGVDSLYYTKFIGQLDTLKMIIDSHPSIGHVMAKNYLILIDNIQSSYRQERDLQDKYPFVALKPDTNKTPPKPATNK